MSTASQVARSLPFLLVALTGCKESLTPTPLHDLPRPLTAAEEEVIGASNRFAFGLFHEVNRQRAETSVLLSPISASMALGMTLNGARGETFEAMRSTLGFDALTMSQVNQSYRGLIDLLLKLDPTVDMRVANSIWYRREMPFEPAFFDTTRHYFGAEVAGLDFADPGAPRTINQWVDRSTNGKIRTLVERINPLDVMFLINAIYFKGAWTEPFARDQTRDDWFTTAGGERVPVKLMNRDGRYRYLRTERFQAVDLPYGNGAFSMTVLLPQPGQDLDALIASLDARQWAEWMGGFEEQRIHLSLPRFRLEYEEHLVEALQALGMEIAFQAGAADFSGMSRAFGRDLFISDVLQKTFVEVNEEGTEAAAATKVTMGVTSAAPSMRVDRPFLFAIRERFSGTILFLGKIAEMS